MKLQCLYTDRWLMGGLQLGLHLVQRERDPGQGSITPSTPGSNLPPSHPNPPIWAVKFNCPYIHRHCIFSILCSLTSHPQAFPQYKQQYTGSSPTCHAFEKSKFGPTVLHTMLTQTQWTLCNSDNIIDGDSVYNVRYSCQNSQCRYKNVHKFAIVYLWMKAGNIQGES